VAVGLRFQPGGAASLLRTSCAQLVGVRLRLECFWGRDARRLEESLSEATVPDEIAHRLEAELARRMTKVDPPDRMPGAIFRLVGSATDQGPVLRRLTLSLGLSERTIRRHCIDAFGFGPKTLDRILRFQQFLERLRPPCSSEMASIAASVGYSDQAHLTREARFLAGVTPSIARAQLAERVAPDAGLGRSRGRFLQDFREPLRILEGTVHDDAKS
jgi:AraC-like DNA-binding protein